MGLCLPAILLTAVLCVGGRGPGERDTRDTSWVEPRQSGARPPLRDLIGREVKYTQPSSPDTTPPPFLAQPTVAFRSKELFIQTNSDPSISHQTQSLSQSSALKYRKEIPHSDISDHFSYRERNLLYQLRKKDGTNHGRTTTNTEEDNNAHTLTKTFGASGTLPHSVQTDQEQRNPQRKGYTSKVMKPADSVSNAKRFPKSFNCSICKCYQVNNTEFVADCSGQDLEEVPSSLPPTVTELLLGGNQLLNLTDEAFSHFPDLTLLDLNNNRITHISNATFKGLGKLRVLYLHGNRLRYTREVFPAEVLAPLRSLQHLTLHNNTADMAEDMDYPDLALSRLPLLDTLSLDGLTNRSFGPGFSKLTALTTLSLSGLLGFCHMDTIENTTFEMVASLQNISIVQCGLRYIEKEAFFPLRNITVLDLSKNTKLGLDNATNALYGLQNSSIRVIYLNEISSFYAVCVILRKKHTQYLEFTNVEEIHIEQNVIQWIEDGALLALSHNVKKLYVRGNNFKFGPYWSNLPAITTLEALYVGLYSEAPPVPFHSHDIFAESHDMYHRDPLKLCDLNFETKLSSDTAMTEKQEGMSPQKPDFQSEIFSLPPNLKTLSLRGMMMRYTLIPFSFSENNSLEIIDASFNLFKAWVGPLKNLHQLKSINLSQTYTSDVRRTMFADSVSVKILDISYNALSKDMAKSESRGVFDPLKSLQHLNMSFNGLYRLPEELFRGLPSLETLNLANNKLRADDFLVDLSHMTNLSLLDLSSNLLQKLTPETSMMIDRLTAAGNLSLRVDLRNNPLACTCGNLDFLRWLREAHVQLVQWQEQQCIYENASHVHLWAGLEELEGSCEGRGLLFAGSALAFLSLCCVLVGLVLYRFRWKLRYLYYVSRERYMEELVAREDFRYDVFLSYATEDHQWVTGPLLAHLEDQGLRVCFHQRDFLPGRPIAANIVEAVQTSRRTACVLSQNFLESQWCLYEMQMAVMEGVHSRRDVLLLLLYEHVCPRALPREVLHYFQTDSYLEYPRDPRCVPYFWENLTMALR